MPNRYVCSALAELRTYLESHYVIYEVEERRAAFISTLIEEIQTYVNRMESGLSDKWDLHRYQEELQELKQEVRALRAEKEALSEAPKKKKRKGSNVLDIL